MKPATFALALGTALLIAVPAAAAEDTTAPTLVEAQPSPDGHTHDEEWVEFANPAPTALDLEGLFLTDHDACFAPGEGYVETYRLALDNVTVPARDRVVVELPASPCLNLADGGDDLFLEDEQGKQIQQVAYGSEGELPAPGTGESLSACQATAERWSDRQPMIHGDWSTAMASPGNANPSCSPGR
ncbi:hypothetical protein BRD56_10590 [Thermoplasmatales archaeon SW_10_69_26]|nr:MAG: hypothetical protein BRD56_10590 [Thermoplasmatales archaeon SW_10_69_26]